MARKPGSTYPSDHRRWFKVVEDVLEDEGLAEVGLEDVGLYVLLLACLNRQKSRDGIGQLNRQAACALARRERWKHAQRAYERLETVGLIQILDPENGVTSSRGAGAGPARSSRGAGAGAPDASWHAGTVRYHVPNWPKIQGFAPELPQSYPDVAPDKKTKTKKKKIHTDGVGEETALPDPFPAEDFDRLSEDLHAGKLGAMPSGATCSAVISYALAVVRDWHEAGGTPIARRKRTQKGWNGVLRNGMRSGWLFEGFDPKAAQRAGMEATKARAAAQPELLESVPHGTPRMEDL